jgi:hypothetical protein
MSPNPHFAYHAGQRLHVSAHGMYGFAILSSMNYRQMMKFAVEYHQLATPVVECKFSEAGGFANWTFEPAPKADEDARIAKFTIEMQFGILIPICDVIGPEFAPANFVSHSRHPTTRRTIPGFLGPRCVRTAEERNAVRLGMARRHAEAWKRNHLPNGPRFVRRNDRAAPDPLRTGRKTAALSDGEPAAPNKARRRCQGVKLESR